MTIETDHEAAILANYTFLSALSDPVVRAQALRAFCDLDLARREADQRANQSLANTTRFHASWQQCRQERDDALARSAQLEAVLSQIAAPDDSAMQTAQTLHWDMRGWARAVLEEKAS